MNAKEDILWEKADPDLISGMDTYLDYLANLELRLQNTQKTLEKYDPLIDEVGNVIFDTESEGISQTVSNPEWIKLQHEINWFKNSLRRRMGIRYNRLKFILKYRCFGKRPN